MAHIASLAQSLLTLPTETQIQIFSSLSTLTDAYNLADTCRPLRLIYQCHRCVIEPAVCRSHFAPFGVTLVGTRYREELFERKNIYRPWTPDVSVPLVKDPTIHDMFWEEKGLVQPLLQAYKRIRRVSDDMINDAAMARFRAAVHRVSLFGMRWYRTGFFPDCDYDFGLSTTNRGVDGGTHSESEEEESDDSDDDEDDPNLLESLQQLTGELPADPSVPVNAAAGTKPAPPPYVQFLEPLTTEELLDLEDMRQFLAALLEELYPAGFKCKKPWIAAMDYGTLQRALNTLDPLTIAGLLLDLDDEDESYVTARKDEELDAVNGECNAFLGQALEALLRKRGWNRRAGVWAIMKNHVLQKPTFMFDNEEGEEEARAEDLLKALGASPWDRRFALMYQGCSVADHPSVPQITNGHGILGGAAVP